MTAAKYYCQKCATEFDFQAVEDSSDVSCPACEYEGCNPVRTDSVDQPDHGKNADEPGSDLDDSQPETHEDPETQNEWVQELPPKFLVDDPEFVDRRLGSPANAKVLIPDGRGGVQGVQQNIVRIEHKGEMIELIALSPEEKRRRQLIINIVSIVIGVLVLVAFFSWI